jgi:hypothetical protein
VGIFADQELIIVLKVSAFLQLIDLRQENLGINDNAVADEAFFMRVKGSRGDEMQDHRLTAYNDGVPGVIPPLKPDDHIGEFSQKVNDLPFALISPLHPNNNNISHKHLF